MAGIPRIPAGDRREEEDLGFVGPTQAREPKVGMLRVWPQVRRCLRQQGAGSAGAALEPVPDYRTHRGISGEVLGLWGEDREGAAVAEQGTFQSTIRGSGR